MQLRMLCVESMFHEYSLEPVTLSVVWQYFITLTDACDFLALEQFF